MFVGNKKSAGQGKRYDDHAAYEMTPSDLNPKRSSLILDLASSSEGLHTIIGPFLVAAVLSVPCSRYRRYYLWGTFEPLWSFKFVFLFGLKAGNGDGR